MYPNLQLISMKREVKTQVFPLSVEVVFSTLLFITFSNYDKLCFPWLTYTCNMQHPNSIKHISDNYMLIDLYMLFHWVCSATPTYPGEGDGGCGLRQQRYDSLSTVTTDHWYIHLRHVPILHRNK